VESKDYSDFIESIRESLLRSFKFDIDMLDILIDLESYFYIMDYKVHLPNKIRETDIVETDGNFVAHIDLGAKEMTLLTRNNETL